MNEHDRITLTGLRARGHHGVFDFERRDGQEFVVDVTLWFSLATAAGGDDLGATVDYGEVARAVAEIVSGQPVDLIETLAERIAEHCLSYRPVRETEITVHKPHAPLPVAFDDVAVTVRRSVPA